MSDTSTLPKLAVPIPEACRMLSIGETLLREQMADGRLPFSRIVRKGKKRGRTLIKVADLEKLLVETTVKP
jgi:hypothetical protein